MSKVNLNITPSEEWLPKADGPVIVSGPCSAETEEQVMETAKGVAATGKVHILRAGIWKPRTRPNSFEGIGEEGLPWLVNAAKATGLLSSTEVANGAHVEAALKAGVDILWVGARTTVNPFSVQEVADALKGADVPVLVKNPINPDLQLWIGALERINQAGITKLGGIHRGFSSFEKSPFRNLPKWELAIEIKRMIPELPLFNDPSHIAGNRDLIPFVCQKALDLDMDGLMIEAHITPDVAWSDAAQQVTPDNLGKILNELTFREPASGNTEFTDHLADLRAIIDELDDDLIQKMSSRMQIAEKIGKYKKENNVTILQVNRWDEIIKKRMLLGDALGLDEEFMKKWLQLIHKESIRRQTAVMNEEKVTA